MTQRASEPLAIDGRRGEQRVRPPKFHPGGVTGGFRDGLAGARVRRGDRNGRALHEQLHGSEALQRDRRLLQRVPRSRTGGGSAIGETPQILGAACVLHGQAYRARVAEQRERGGKTARAIAREPFEASRQPFAFRDADYAARSRDVATRFVKSLAYSPPPRRIVFLHRKLGGLFHLLRRLDVELDLRPYWEKMVA